MLLEREVANAVKPWIPFGGPLGIVVHLGIDVRLEVLYRHPKNGAMKVLDIRLQDLVHHQWKPLRQEAQVRAGIAIDIKQHRLA